MPLIAADRGCFTPWLSGKGAVQNFIAVDREQSFLLPPSLLDWVPEDRTIRAGSMIEMPGELLFRREPRALVFATFLQ